MCSSRSAPRAAAWRGRWWRQWARPCSVHRTAGVAMWAGGQATALAWRRALELWRTRACTPWLLICRGMGAGGGGGGGGRRGCGTRPSPPRRSSSRATVCCGRSGAARLGGSCWTSGDRAPATLTLAHQQRTGCFATPLQMCTASRTIPRGHVHEHVRSARSVRALRTRAASVRTQAVRACWPLHGGLLYSPARPTGGGVLPDALPRGGLQTRLLLLVRSAKHFNRSSEAMLSGRARIGSCKPDELPPPPARGPHWGGPHTHWCLLACTHWPGQPPITPMHAPRLLAGPRSPRCLPAARCAPARVRPARCRCQAANEGTAWLLMHA